jgi:hypothetical protein
MKPEQTSVPVPQPVAGSSDFAAAYIAQELPKARTALKRARIIGLALVALVGGYISFISLTLVRFAQPREAAQIASGMVIQHLATEGPVLASQLEREIPTLIRQLPDYLIRELPSYRRDVELALESELEVHCAALAKQLGQQMDEQIETHQADLKTLFGHPNDRAVLRTVLPNLDQTLTTFLTADADGKVVQEHINDLAAGLKEIEKHMDRLANANDLTPEEKKARRSLAVLAKAIKDKTKTPELAAAPVGKLASR